MALRKKCPYSESFWSVFSHIRIEYGEIRSTSPYSVRMRENTDQNKSKYEHILRTMEDEGEYKKFLIMTSEIFDDLLNLKIM